MTGRQIEFSKMNGVGNAIIVADMRGRADTISPEAARRLNALSPFDQIMELHAPAGAGHDLDINIWNSDGSPAQACGNGTRCVVAWLNQRDGKRRYRLRTTGGMLEAWIGADTAQQPCCAVLAHVGRAQ